RRNADLVRALAADAANQPKAPLHAGRFATHGASRTFRPRRGIGDARALRVVDLRRGRARLPARADGREDAAAAPRRRRGGVARHARLLPGRAARGLRLRARLDPRARPAPPDRRAASPRPPPASVPAGRAAGERLAARRKPDALAARPARRYGRAAG